MLHIILLLFAFTHLSCATLSKENPLFSQDDTTWYFTNELPSHTASYQPGLHIFLRPPGRVFVFQVDQRESFNIPISALYKYADGNGANFLDETFVNVYTTLEYNPQTEAKTLSIDTIVPFGQYDNIINATTPNTDIRPSTLTVEVEDAKQTLLYPIPYENDFAYLRISSSPKQLFLVDYLNGTLPPVKVFPTLSTTIFDVWKAK